MERDHILVLRVVIKDPTEKYNDSELAAKIAVMIEALTDVLDLPPASEITVSQAII